MTLVSQSCGKRRVFSVSIVEGLSFEISGKSPIFSPDIDFEASPDFRLKIVRDFADQASNLLSDPSPYRATISLSRPLSAPDRKSSGKMGGMCQPPRDARAVS